MDKAKLAQYMFSVLSYPQYKILKKFSVSFLKINSLKHVNSCKIFTS